MEWSNAEWDIVGFQDIDGNYHDLTKEDYDFSENDLYTADWVTVGFRDAEGADPDSWEFDDYSTFAGPWDEWDQFVGDIQDYIENEGAS